MRFARAALICVAVVAVTCGPCLHARLQGDDFIWLYDASRIGGPVDLFVVHDVPFAPYDGVRLNPVNTLFLALLWPLFGLDAVPYHIAVLLVYAATGLLVRAWLLARGTGETAALLGALLFLVWPLHAEPVAWLSAVGEVLVGFFSMAALVAWDRASRVDARGGLWTAVATASVALAVLSKEAAFVLPLVLLLSDLTLPERRVDWRRQLLAWAIAGVAAFWKHASISAARADIGIHPASLSLADAAAGTVRYLVHAVAGAPLAAQADGGAIVAMALLIAAVVTIVVLWRRGHPNAAFHAAWLLVAVQPYVWGVPLQTLQPRYAYQPSLPLAVLAALALDVTLRRCLRRGARVGVTAVGSVGLAFLGFVLRGEVAAYSPPDDGEVLRASLAAATRNLAPDDRVFVYNPLNAENAMARAVVLYGAARAGQVHEWHEALGRDVLDRHDRFVCFEASSRRYSDVTDAVQALHAGLRGRIATPRPRDEVGLAGAWTMADDGLRGTGDGLPARWIWTADGMLVLNGLDLSPLAVCMLDVEIGDGGDPNGIALLWTSVDSPTYSSDCVVMPTSTRRTANGVTLRFVPADRAAWWTRGHLRALFLRSTAPGPLPAVRGADLYTFGDVR